MVSEEQTDIVSEHCPDYCHSRRNEVVTSYDRIESRTHHRFLLILAYDLLSMIASKAGSA